MTRKDPVDLAVGSGTMAAMAGAPAGSTRRLVAGVAVWNVLQNSVPRRWYGWLNAVGSLLVVATGRSSGLSTAELGLDRDWLRRGIRIGGPPAALVVAATQAAAASETGLRWFRDERVERRGAAELAKETLFRIPIGTALFEELLFRGLLLGRFARAMPVARANMASSVIFGLWHIIPTIKTLRTYRSGALQRTPAGTAGSTALAVLATTVAGLVLGSLRVRARSVAAPTIVHAAINVASFVNAWRAAAAAD